MNNMEDKIKLCYLDEQEQWQYMAHQKLGNDFDLRMLEQSQFPNDVSNIWSIIFDMNVDVVIVDYKLNESGILPYTGDQVIHEIRKHNLHLPVFMITSFELNALQESEEVQVIRGKDMLANPEKFDLLKTLIISSVNKYRTKKEKCEELIYKLASKIDAGETLSEEEEANKFDAELYLSELDLDSGFRKHLISQDASQKLSDMVNLAHSILEHLSK